MSTNQGLSLLPWVPWDLLLVYSRSDHQRNLPDNPVRNHKGVTLAHYEVQNCLVLPGEVLVVDVLRHRHLGDVKLCGGGHKVPLVHPPTQKKRFTTSVATFN